MAVVAPEMRPARAALMWGRVVGLRPLAAVLLASIAVRACVALASPVQATPDSPGYVALADSLRHRTLAGDPGERTPVYPLFLALLHLHLPAIRLAQMAIGVCVTAALFWLGWRTTRSTRAAIVLSAGYGCSLTAALHENAILTEALATALLVALACLLALLLDPAAQHVGRSITALALAASVCAGLIALTRPLYAFLPAVLVLALVFRRPVGVSRHRVAIGICAIFVPAMALIGGWSAVNAARFGSFSPTVLTGYSLSNHSGGFIEYAPERDAVLRDIYLHYRAETIHETGSHVTTIWAARPELLARTGLSNATLSRAFISLSLRLFLHHPLRYARSVAGAWARFWNAPGEWHWHGARDPRIGTAVGVLWAAERAGFIAFNVLFLALTIGGVVSRGFRTRWRPPPLIVTLTAIVWETAIVQALLENGSNTRFGVPTEPLVVYVVIASLSSLAPRVARTGSVAPFLR